MNKDSVHYITPPVSYMLCERYRGKMTCQPERVLCRVVVVSVAAGGGGMVGVEGNERGGSGSI